MSGRLQTAALLCSAFAVVFGSYFLLGHSPSMPAELDELPSCANLTLESYDAHDLGGVTVDYIDSYFYVADNGCLDDIYELARRSGFSGDREGLTRENKPGSRDELIFDWKNGKLEWVDWET